MAGIHKLTIMLILFSCYSTVTGLYLIRSFYPHVDTSNYLYNPAISPFPVAGFFKTPSSPRSAPAPPSDFPYSFSLPSSEKRFSKQPVILPEWMHIGHLPY